MSSTLKWRPLGGGKALPTALKFALDKRGWSYPVTIGDGELSYLQGLCDAGVEGAETLLAAIEKHGEVELTKEY